MMMGRGVQIAVLIVGFIVLFFGFAALLPLGGFGPVFGETVERTFAPSATAVAVHNFNGPVVYETWDDPDILIAATVRVRGWTEAMARRSAASVDISFRDDDGRARAEAQWMGGLFGRGGVSVRWTVHVPRSWSGDVAITTRNGPISARQMSGDAVLRSSNGSITVEGHVGPLEAQTSNGRIEMAKVEGAVRARTSNGSVRIENGVLSGNGFLRTSNGRISVDGEFIDGADYDALTSNGSVDVTLRSEAGRVR